MFREATSLIQSKSGGMLKALMKLTPVFYSASAGRFSHQAASLLCVSPLFQEPPVERMRNSKGLNVYRLTPYGEKLKQEILSRVT